MSDGRNSEIVVTAVKRANTLHALTGRSLTRSELQDEIEVSRTTTHRIVRELSDKSLIRRVGGTYELTPLGRIVAKKVEHLQDTVSVAEQLSALLPSLVRTDMNVELLADATITVQESNDPYRPVRRFISLLRDSETLCGFDTTTIAPMYVDEIRDSILDGMQTEVIYLPQVIDQILGDHRDATEKAIGSGQLELFVHDELPFGLAIFDDRVGVGGYDETGILRVFADTDSAEVRSWAESLYAEYRAESTSIREHDGGAE
jgi:predicted transcriptional regulator